MGQNLALNIADHGFKVAVYNRTTEIMEKFVARENPEPPAALVGCETLEGLRRRPSRSRARSSSWSRPARPSMRSIKQLLDAGVEPGDIVIDCGNSQWTDTIRREKEYADKVQVLRLRRLRRRGRRALRPVADARRRPGLLEAPQAHLGSHRRQGRSPRPASRSKTPPPASPSPAACPAPPTSAPTAPATTSR